MRDVCLMLGFLVATRAVFATVHTPHRRDVFRAFDALGCRITGQTGEALFVFGDDAHSTQSPLSAEIYGVVGDVAFAACHTEMDVKKARTFHAIGSATRATRNDGAVSTTVTKTRVGDGGELYALGCGSASETASTPHAVGARHTFLATKIRRDNTIGDAALLKIIRARIDACLANDACKIFRPRHATNDLAFVANVGRRKLRVGDGEKRSRCRPRA